MAGLARRLTALAASASTSIEHIGRLSIPCTSATTTPCSRNGNWAFAHPRFVGRFSSAVPEWPPAGVQPSPFMKVRLVPPLSWKELEAHHPQNEGTPMAYGTDIERAQADRRALMEGRRPSRTSWLLARIQEAGTTGVEFQTLCQLAEAHVPGLYRSRSQIRSQLQLLRSQGKVRMPGGKYMCKSLYLMEKEKRRKEYEARVQSRKDEAEKKQAMRRF